MLIDHVNWFITIVSLAIMALEDESPRLHVDKNVDNHAEDEKNEENDPRCEPVPEIAPTTERSPADHQVKSQKGCR